MFDKLQDVLRKYDALQAERRAARRTDPPNVTVPESLCRATELASWMAYFALVYFLWIYTLDIARDRAGNLHITHLGGWTGDLQFWFPHIIGFAVVAIGIPYVAKIAIPTFTRLGWREAPTEKSWALFIAVAVSLVVIAGTFTVQGDNILERDRAGVVATQQAAQENAVLGARIEDVQDRLDELTQNQNVYTAIAASMSPEEFQRTYIDERPNDWQRERFRSAIGASRDAAALRQQLSQLREQQARQTVTAQVAGRVTNGANDWIAATLAWLEGARAMLLSFVMDIVCLIMPLIALRLRLKRNQQLGMADGIPQHAYMIEDARSEASPVHAAGVDAALDVLLSGGDREAAAEAARAATRPVKPTPMVKEADGTTNTVEYYERKGGMVRKPKRKDRSGQTETQVEFDRRPIEVTNPAGDTFTATYAEEKDGRSVGPAVVEPEEPQPALEDISESAVEQENIEQSQQPDSPSGNDELAHPEPSTEEALAFLDSLTLDAPNEPEQHSTDERADDAAAEEVAEAPVVADEGDAVAEEDEALQDDEPAYDSHVKARALLPAA